MERRFANSLDLKEKSLTEKGCLKPASEHWASEPDRPSLQPERLQELGVRIDKDGSERACPTLFLSVLTSPACPGRLHAQAADDAQRYCQTWLDVGFDYA
jgi:hypothetical protein